jgi:hypothetical protein
VGGWDKERQGEEKRREKRERGREGWSERARRSEGKGRGEDHRQAALALVESRELEERTSEQGEEGARKKV